MIQDERLSRRGLLNAAGGFTFLALSPRVLGAYEPDFETRRLPEGPGDSPARPVVTALPYLQPGPNSSRLVEGEESMVIAWQTDPVPARFALTYGPRGDEYKAEIEVAHRGKAYEYVKDARINYFATLTGLKLRTKIRYRVTMDGERLVEGFFTTRAPRGYRSRFVAFGDNSNGDPGERAIAYYAYLAKPDFVINTGDNVYNDGLDGQYAKLFFPVYNADEANLRIGAPLLRSVPFYSVLANHDINAEDAQGHPLADFDKNPDSLAYYTNFHFPLNGPVTAYPSPTKGDTTEFKTAAGSRFPTMANYSFDYGEGHFLCLDGNVTIDPTDAALRAWIVEDLSKTDAKWKIVVYHHPAFNVGNEHFEEQHMRALSPLLEEHGVDLVLNGHEHVYQRTRPLRFSPSDLTAAHTVGESKRLIPGQFTVDRKFDGTAITKPEGIIYVTTGAGGNSLYDPEMNRNPKNWLHKEDLEADYVAQMVTDRHSLTVIDMEEQTLTLRQIDEWGQEIDHVRISK